MHLKKIITIILLIGFALPIFCQQIKPRILVNDHAIRGIVNYTTDQNLKDASVIILNSSDSVIRQFTHTQLDGSFLINGIKNGNYILYISYPGYVDYTEQFALDSNQINKDFKVIDLLMKANLLKEVVIKRTVAAIQIKGDTTEHNANAYILSPNAKVEDLLKMLPGIQIDKDGKISAQGQTINKVLVDGEEFFEDDPTLVTRNLRADMVDKVQLFDKKSDQAILTGMNDGKTDRTLNIKLKEDKKNGYFGKAEVGVGTDGYYSGQLMFNSFRAKRRFSVYGITGNNGKVSLDWQDNSKYATSNIDISSPGMMIDLGGYDELESHSGRYDGKGLPVARTSGVHYDNKWKEDKFSVNANYKIGTLTVDGTNNIKTQNNIPSVQLNSNADQAFHSRVFRQKIDGVFQFKPDSTSSLKVTLNGGIKNAEQNNQAFTSTKNETGALLNNNQLSSTLSSDQQDLSGGMLFTKKLNKSGRTFSFNFIGSVNKINSIGLLKSKINFYSNGFLDSIQSVNQVKENTITNNLVNTHASYSEPLSREMLMVVSYGLSMSSSASNRSAFNTSIDVHNRFLDSLYSNNYEVNQLSNQMGLNFNLVRNKTILAFGSKISIVKVGQLDMYSKRKLNRNFKLWNPQVNLEYRITQQSSIRLNYEGNTLAPTVEQLQPVLVNNDPLNITQGNPELKPSFTQHIHVGYQSYKPLNGQLVGIFLGYQLTARPVVSNLLADSLGRTINRYINLDGQNTNKVNFSIFYDRKIKPLDLNAGINLNINGDTYYNLSNNKLNRTNYIVYTLQARFSKTKTAIYEFNGSIGPSYTISGSSLQENINNNGRGVTSSGDITLYLPHKFQLYTNANYQYNSKTETFAQNFSRLIINATLSKLFLREQTLKLSLSGHDLLNQNTGFNRNILGNLITQSNYSTIRRYFVISISYDFNKMGANKIANK